VDASLIGKAKELEVASILVRNGLYVFFPLVDAGIDLVVTNRSSRQFIPVQVKFRGSNPALGLTKQDIARFRDTDTIVAFIIGTGPAQRTWFVPFRVWESMAVDLNRADDLVYVTISRNESALSQFAGDDGVRIAFASLLNDRP
jgi:hypothetical protein